MKKMTLERDLHMVGGTGESSYAANSTYQKKIASGALFMVKAALESLVSAIPSSEMLLVFADMGCSTGANTFLIFPEVMRVISEICNKLGRPVPEIQLLLNDLPGNDFNTLFDSVLSSYKQKMNESMREKYMPFYTAAVAGSFYDRLLPQRSVHFVYSCTSLHWLSQVPLGLNSETEGPINKTSFWISKKSPPLVSKLYLEQFQKDFSSFLKHRAEELRPEGRMALIFSARTSVNPSTEECAVWMSWYEEALRELVSQGTVKASDVDSFNIPMYLASIEEVKSIIEMEGSFEIIEHDVSQVLYRDGVNDISDDAGEQLKKFEKIGRALLEPLLVSHFGDPIIDPLFSVAPKIFAKYFWKEEHKSSSIAISLKKKP